MTETLPPIAAVDILADGTARPVTEPWPDAQARAGLLQAETRPRCDVIDGGLVLALRAMNLNPGQAAEDMVSLRLWVTPTLIVSTRFRRMFVIE